MALYTNELAAERMRERARLEMEKAKQMAAIEEARRRERFQRETAKEPAHEVPEASVLEGMTRAELYEHAKRVGVRGRSKMSKAALIEAVRHAW
jgi:hypothetical protein